MRIRPFLLERYFAKYEFNTPYLLCSSDCETISIEELLSSSNKKEEYLENLLKLRLGYTQSLGDPILREKISNLYSSGKIGKENILTFSGAQEGIFLLINSLLTSRDHIICIFPAYQSLYEIAKSLNLRVDFWKFEEYKDWYLDLNKLEKLIKKNTKLIIVNFPHNPTGYCPSKEYLRQIISICQRKGIYLFSDEVYRFLEYDISIDNKSKIEIKERETDLSVCELYENAISLGVMSKSFGLAGLRIGWIATKNKKVLNKLAIMKDYTTICSSAPSEFLASVALDNKEKIIRNIKNIVYNNLIYLINFFNKYKNYFYLSLPKGGSIAFTYYHKNTDLLSKKLIEKKGILLMPSSKFQYDKNHFRIGFGRKNMAEALKLFDQFCEENIDNL